MELNAIGAQLDDTRDAFDSVAPDYDGPRGNNALIQRMRDAMWRYFHAAFPAGGRLIDLGCGTGLDAIYLAQQGYHVTATDWSPEMVARTADRARQTGLTERVRALNIGAHELEKLDGDGQYDGAYSDLGPLNCVPDLGHLSRQCARLITPGGVMVFSVIGRLCPWEVAHYALQRRWPRVKIRFAKGTVAVGMNKRRIWTNYYWPREFADAFRNEFVVERIRALCLFVPPPYLTWVQEQHPRLFQALWRLDDALGGWPLLRDMGDHFVIWLRRKT